MGTTPLCTPLSPAVPPVSFFFITQLSLSTQQAELLHRGAHLSHGIEEILDKRLNNQSAGLMPNELVANSLVNLVSPQPEQDGVLQEGVVGAADTDHPLHHTGGEGAPR